MKRLILIFDRLVLILLGLVFFGPVDRTAAQEVIGITQCYEWAKANYPLIRQYRLIEKTAHYTLSNARKGWLPQLSVNAKVSYQSGTTRLPFDVEKLASVVPGLEIPRLNKDQYQVVAELKQTLWDGGEIQVARESSRAQAATEQARLESNLYELNGRINQLYFGSLLQDELIGQNASLQKDIQMNLQRIEAMMENGVANQSDRESLEVELLNARQQEIELKAIRSAYRHMLGMLIGKEEMENISLQIPSVPGEILPSVIARPELRTFAAEDRQLEIGYHRLTAGLMPKVGLFVQGGYGRPGLNMLENNFELFYMAGVRLTWNMGKLYTLKNDRHRLEVNRQTVGVQRETFLFNTRMDLIRQKKEIRKIAELIKTDQEIISLRTRIKEAAEIKLANGVISVTDLIREINAEDVARQAAAAHRIQRLAAIYNYMYTTNGNVE